MKILFLSDDFLPDSDVRGGAGIVAFRLAQEFVRQGHEVHAITASAHAEKCDTSVVEHIRVHRLHSPHNHDRWRSYRSLYNPRVVKQVNRVIAEIQPDIIHAHTVHLYLSYAALMVARRHCRKVFLTVHDVMPFYPGTFTEFINPHDMSCPTSFNYRVTARMMIKKFRLRYNPLRNVTIRYVLKRMTGIIAVSEALRDALLQNNILVHAVVRNGIDVASRAVSAVEVESFRKMHGLDPVSPVVLWGGRLSGAKGGALLLAAFPDILKTQPTTKLLVMGQVGEYTERMKRVATELGVVDSVIFTDWLDEAASKKAYAASTVVAVPSVCFDSFPTGNLEGFAAHKPVVATCFGGSREIVHEKENGRIVNPFDVPALAAALGEFVKDTSLAQRYGEAGYTLVADQYTIDRMARDYLTFFNQPR